MNDNTFEASTTETGPTPKASASSKTSLATRPRNNGATPNPMVRTVSPLKRKPEDGIGGPPPKMSKPDAQKATPSSASRPGSSSGLAPKAATLSLNRSASSVATKPAAQVGRAAAAPASLKPAPKPASAAPPKGSYRDMIARARAAQSSSVAQPSPTQPAPVKRGPPMGRRQQERMEARQRARQGLKEGKDPAAAATGSQAKSSAKSPNVKLGAKKQVEAPAVKKKKDRPPLEYKGTMRGNAVTSTSKPAAGKSGVVSAKKKSAGGYSSASGSEVDAADSGKHYRYAAYSDEEEGEAEDGYDSEGSSEMEGNGFDALEAEEEASLRAARKEDAAALREEEAHRKEKLDRKNKLQALAAKAKPPRY